MILIKDAYIPVHDGNMHCMHTNDVRCLFNNTDKSGKESLKLKTLYMMFLRKDVLNTYLH